MKIVPLEVIVRNIAAGSLAERLGVPEGTKMASTVLEFCYKMMIWATRSSMNTISAPLDWLQMRM